MLTYQEIYAKVSTALVEALNVDEADITPSASLQRDLGAESIDFLDVVFRLERVFGVRISRDELFPESIFAGDPDCVQDGRVTAKGLELLRQTMPLADLGKFEQDPDASRLGDLFTVDLLTRYIQDKLGHGQGC
jgi:acyl carrier protein